MTINKPRAITRGWCRDLELQELPLSSCLLCADAGMQSTVQHHSCGSCIPAPHSPGGSSHFCGLNGGQGHNCIPKHLCCLLSGGLCSNQRLKGGWLFPKICLLNITDKKKKRKKFYLPEKTAQIPRNMQFKGFSVFFFPPELSYPMYIHIHKPAVRRIQEKPHRWGIAGASQAQCTFSQISAPTLLTSDPQHP